MRTDAGGGAGQAVDVVASAGTVDEADTGIVRFNQGIASMAAGAAVGAALDIRYNVVAVDGVFGGDGIALPRGSGIVAPPRESFSG